MMKETREALKARILDGAIALFTDKGIENVTTRELTEHLGISRSHIYHYFQDWEALCREAITFFLQQDLASFSARLTGMTAEVRLSAFVTNYLPAAPDAAWQIYSSLWQLAIHDAGWAEMAQRMMDQWQTLLANILWEGVRAGAFHSDDPEQVARLLGAMLNGYADQLILSPSPAPHQAAIDDIGSFIRLALQPH